MKKKKIINSIKVIIYCYNSENVDTDAHASIKNYCKHRNTNTVVPEDKEVIMPPSTLRHTASLSSTPPQPSPPPSLLLVQVNFFLYFMVSQQSM